MAILHEGATFIGCKAERDNEAFSELTGSVRAFAVRVVKYENLVFSSTGIDLFGRGSVFVGVDGVFKGGHGPHTSSGIPGDSDGFTDALLFAGDEFSGKTFGKGEARQLFGWC